jgi:aldose 1-epimerase
LTIHRAPFGQLPDGRAVESFTLVGARGLEVRALDYGGIITSVLAPDRAGRRADVVLGFDALADYVADTGYTGALIGRFANRIAGGTFTLGGREVRLAMNEAGRHHLHGGGAGFHRVLWHAEPFEGGAGPGLTLRYTSPEGEEGYPGTLDVRVSYTVTDDNTLLMDFEARTDRLTHVNLTSHGYWNLHGDGAGSTDDHVVTIAASHYLPVDAELIPTGEIAPVEGTAFDFRRPRRLGGHFDHNWVLDGAGKGLAPAATVADPASGRVLTIRTTEPGLQMYTGNPGGIALETQHFPDSPHHPAFPTTVLRPGDHYQSRTVFALGVAPD